MSEVRGELQELNASHRLTAQRTDGLQRSVTQVQSDLEELNQIAQQTAERTGRLVRSFEGFQVRVNEALEMVVQHDTEQLQRVSKVELENIALREQMTDVLRRLEVLEKRAS